MIGCRLRARRKMLAKTREEVAGEIGISGRQLQKYERGTASLSVAALLELSRALDAPLSYFIGAVGHPGSGSESQEPGQSDSNASFALQHQTYELVTHFYRIRTGKVRRDMLQLIKTVADAQPALDEGEEISSE